MCVPFTMFANLCWNPALSVPAGVNSEGMPVGLQIMGRRHLDEVPLRLGRIFEQTRPWPRHAPADASPTPVLTRVSHSIPSRGILRRLDDRDRTATATRWGIAVGDAPRGFWAAAQEDPSRLAVVDAGRTVVDGR